MGPTQDRLEKLAVDMGVDTYPTYDEGESLLFAKGRITRYTGTIPSSRHRARGRGPGPAAHRSHGGAGAAGPPWPAPKAEQWDGQTFETWIRRNVVTPTGRAMVRLMVTSVFGAEPCDLSLLHLLAYVHSAGLQDRALSVTGGRAGAPFRRRLAGGGDPPRGQLGDVVRLDTPVRVIVHEDARVTVEADNDTAHARRAIVAVPPRSRVASSTTLRCPRGATSSRRRRRWDR